MKNIFVGNLDFNASEEGVRSLFERYGQVNSARIMTDRETGRSRGFAFVEMENEGEADQAISALNGYTLDGRALNVNQSAKPAPIERALSFPAAPRPPSPPARAESALTHLGRNSVTIISGLNMPRRVSRGS